MAGVERAPWYARVDAVVDVKLFGVLLPWEGVHVGWRFRKSFTLGRFLRINLSKKGVGASVGVPGLRIGVGADGKVRRTVSIPGTGLSKAEVLTKQRSTAISCPQCGRRVSKSDSFCKHCGSKLR